MLAAVSTDGRKGNVHESESMREAAIYYHREYPQWTISMIVQILVNHHGLTVPQSADFAKANASLEQKIRRWIRQYKTTGSHRSARQILSAKIKQRKQAALEEKLKIKRRRGTSGRMK